MGCICVWGFFVFFSVRTNMHARRCARTDVRGSLSGVIYNIHHPFCQLHRSPPELEWTRLCVCVEEMCMVGLKKLTSREAAVW